ncbi:MAG: DVU3141 family protein [Sneathiella sp.]
MNSLQSKISLFFQITLLALTLTACSANIFEQPKPTASQSIGEKDSSGRPYADPLANFLLNTPPGQTGTVTLKNGETVLVRVGADYTSAANERCRRMIVEFTDSRSQANAVCFDGTVWKTVLGKP